MKDLNTLSASLRDLIRTKANVSHLPNALIFANNNCTYGHTYYDLMSHTLREKESTMLRMMDGAPYSRQIMHCLLARGQRLISEHHSTHTLALTTTQIYIPHPYSQNHYPIQNTLKPLSSNYSHYNIMLTSKGSPYWHSKMEHFHLDKLYYETT